MCSQNSSAITNKIKTNKICQYHCSSRCDLQKIYYLDNVKAMFVMIKLQNQNHTTKKKKKKDRGRYWGSNNNRLRFEQPVYPGVILLHLYNHPFSFLIWYFRHSCFQTHTLPKFSSDSTHQSGVRVASAGCWHTCVDTSARWPDGGSLPETSFWFRADGCLPVVSVITKQWILTH